MLAILPIFVISSFSQTKGKVTPKSKTEKIAPTFAKANFLFSKDATYYTEDGKNYIVYDAKGYTQKELYNKVLLGVSKLFRNPDKVITKFENEFITINGYNSDCVKYSNLWFSYTYSVKIQFKDDKIRIDTPLITGSGSDEIRSNTEGWIKTQENYNEVKPYFESSMNDLINAFLDSSFLTNEDW